MAKLTLLFEQILSTEQEYQDKSNELKRLNSALQGSNRQLKQVRDRVTYLTGEIVIRNNQLGSELGQLVGSEKQSVILSEQKNVLENELKELRDGIESLENEMRGVDENFIAESKKFLSTIDLTENAMNEKERLVEGMREEIETKIQQKREELKILRGKEMEIIELSAELNNLNEENMFLEDELECLEEKCKAFEIKRTELERGRDEVDRNFSTHKEFRETQIQLERSQNESRDLESAIERIQSEMEHMKSRQHQEDIQIRHSNHKLHLIQHDYNVEGEQSLYGSREGKSFHFYNPYRAQSENGFAVASEDVGEIVDLSGISDFEDDY